MKPFLRIPFLSRGLNTSLGKAGWGIYSPVSHDTVPLFLGMYVFPPRENAGIYTVTHGNLPMTVLDLHLVALPHLLPRSGQRVPS